MIMKNKPLNVGIWAFLNKIPAGTMFVPLVISAIICTITVECGLGINRINAILYRYND